MGHTGDIITAIFTAITAIHHLHKLGTFYRHLHATVADNAPETPKRAENGLGG